jgi:hypothetical protein
MSQTPPVDAADLARAVAGKQNGVLWRFMGDLGAFVDGFGWFSKIIAIFALARRRRPVFGRRLLFSRAARTRGGTETRETENKNDKLWQLST